MSVEPTDAERRGDGQMNLTTDRKGCTVARVRSSGGCQVVFERTAGRRGDKTGSEVHL